MKSLYSKFIVMTLAIMVGSATIGFLLVNTYYHQQLKEQNDLKNVGIAQEMATFIEKNPTVPLGESLEVFGSSGYQLFMADESGDNNFYGGPFRESYLPISIKEAVLNGEIYHGMRDFPKETFVTGFFSNELTNTVGVPVTYKDERYALFIRPNIKMLFTEVHILLGGLAAAMLILSLLAMLIVARRMIQPITVLTEATRKMANERFDGSIAISSNDEIGQLAKSFQIMADRLKENDQVRKDFMSHVSHDFQSPLQNIQGYAQLLADESVTQYDRANYAGIVELESKRLSALTKQLLYLTSLDHQSYQPTIIRVSVKEQIERTIRQNEWRFEDLQLDVRMDMPELITQGNPDMLMQVWENLITNAVKYNQPNGFIHINGYELEDELHITIKDSGIGMTQEQSEKAFDRFYRADLSRTREKEGTGLGLAIVSEIVKRHRGRVKIESDLGLGTLIHITLPKL
ncbi:cell wall metabolism sensor histidine kinase WalK [Paenisporosarcina sp. OV554]|uniref:sensor histidine kinase n=1 Tax=Paenisporosarcina sp. OV554 TaxID=2135694 RepID=UPI000D345C18|nr:HAMP domain-containing sensor histidine kinase [Paenisporosarcina sp. OV554]PUB13326.1 signal transduction histidine kinase [Paenisporosarcina sp. OV554]